MTLNPAKATTAAVALTSLLVSGGLYAEPKRIDCWLDIPPAYPGDTTSNWGIEASYDITFDLATNYAEIKYYEEKGGDIKRVHTGKVEEFPSVLRFTWRSHNSTSVLDVDRTTLGAQYSSDMLKGTGTCTVKKVKKKQKKI
jgi:hypothetical protein